MFSSPLSIPSFFPSYIYFLILGYEDYYCRPSPNGLYPMRGGRLED